MSADHSTATPIDVSVENIGGIDDTEVTLTPGVTVLAGRNATNRTSFLRAMMAGLGSQGAALKGDADEGSVEFDFGGRSYRRTLSRRQGTVVFDGTPYLDDPEYADLYAFLLESNDARQAVERGEDLYDVIMRPVDTERIDDEIARLQEEREALRDRLEALEEVEERLPELESSRGQLRDELDAKRERLEEERTALEALEDEANPSAEIGDRFAALRDVRKDLEDTRRRIEEEERLLNALEADRDELEEQLDGLAEVDEEAMADLQAEIDRHRSAIERTESGIEELESVITFNQSLLADDGAEVVGVLRGDDGERDPVTDQLVEEGTKLTCWTCGSRVERRAVEQTVEALQKAYSRQVEALSSRREDVEEAEAERRHIERTRERQRELERELREIETELEVTVDRLEALESEASECETALAELEEEVDSIGAEGDDERVAQLQAVNELEFEVDRLESELADVEADIEDAEARLEERPSVVDDHEAVADEIEDLRSRIERLEVESVELFNEQMDTIIELLGFDNLERVWIERTETAAPGGRQTGTGTTFDLHIVRSTDAGTVYEDTVDHLSESERELVGLVFALAGYLAHDVYEQVPVMLLDSLEAFDSERLSTLIDYLAGYADHLVVALLPEDAAALDDDYQRITDI